MASDNSFVPPEQFDEYRRLGPLGRGGMGQVYLCQDTRLDRPVAVKFIRHLNADPETQKRFETEARAIARLEAHNNVVAVYRLGEYARRPYLVSQYISGRSLDSVPKPIFWQEVLRIGIGMAQGLAAAHKQRVLHRDIKPANIMLTDDGQVKLLDFGLAKLLDTSAQVVAQDEPPAAVAARISDFSPSSAALAETADFGGNSTPAARRCPMDSLTETGSLMGTPLYMSPEAWRGEPTTPQSDIYSLGAVLYELATGIPPHHDDTLVSLRNMVLSQDAVPLDQLVPDANKRFVAAVARCLRRKASERFASANELCAELAAIVNTPARAAVASPRIALRRRLGTGGGAAMVALLGLGLYWKLWSRPSAMLVIPAGRFLMGSTAKETESAWEWCKAEDKNGCEKEPYEREQPIREVSVSAFRMDRTEVTQSDFVRWLNSQNGLRLDDGRWVKQNEAVLINIYPTFRPSHGIIYDAKRERYEVLPGYERQPVVQVSWDGAQRYCQSHGKRLPTEAEWEFAARGAHARRYPWGNEEPRCDGVVMANSEGLMCAGQQLGPREVGSAPQDRTPEGIYDLGGNVSEWVADFFVPRYPACQPSCVDPSVKLEDLPVGQAALGVLRGGSWNLTASVTRAAARSRWKHADGAPSIGFRCVASNAK